MTGLQIRPPAPLVGLTPHAVTDVPASPGIYAAWIVDADGLHAAGLSATAPLLVYVGKASGSGGLRARLRRHAHAPFYDLAHLLAARGRIVPYWWVYARKRQPGKRSLTLTPLARIADLAALDWQHRHVRWGWARGADPQAVETALIEREAPLLNLRGRGLGALGPPPLRQAVQTEVGAAWMFSVAWIAVLCEQPEGWVKQRLRGLEVRVDADGWPTQLENEGSAQAVRMPTERRARQLLAAALAESRLDASFGADEEGITWWAAYAGLQFRPEPQDPEDAVRCAITGRTETIRFPRRLPDEASRRELLGVIKLLPSVAK